MRRIIECMISTVTIGQGTGIGTVSHVLLLVRLGVAGEQDAGRAVGQQDGHGVVVDLGEQTAFGVRRRSYNVGLTAARASCPCIFIHPTTCRLSGPDPEDLGSFLRAFKGAIYAGCWIRTSENFPSTHS